MRLSRYMVSLIRNDTGDSSKGFFLVCVTITGCLLLLTVGGILAYDALRDGRVDTDLPGLAALVGAVTAVFASAGVTKAMSERTYRKKDDNPS